jgi:hypothetical protein
MLESYDATPLLTHYVDSLVVVEVLFLRLIVGGEAGLHIYMEPAVCNLTIRCKRKVFITFGPGITHTALFPSLWLLVFGLATMKGCRRLQGNVV